MFRRQHLLLSLSVAVGSWTLVGGCSDPAQATPKVTFDSVVSPGKHTQLECTQTGTWLQIGSFGNPAAGHVTDDPASAFKEPVRPVEDGGEDQQGTAIVSCSVVAAGDAFDVALHAELSGATGGAMTLTGHILRGVDSPGVSLALTRKGETYNAPGKCTVTFNTATGHGIAGGRVWAFVDCPDAELPSQQRVCASHAEFRFENCTE